MTEVKSAAYTPPSEVPRYDRHEQMFPTLNSEQIVEIARFGREQTLPRGAQLWDIGERNMDFFVVLEGTLDVVRRDAFGAGSVVASHTTGSLPARPSC
jgi:thioredoxin reductase (NADPH)